jgi:hypothetical protein
MEHARFDDVLDHLLARVMGIMQSKNKEYARGRNKLHNFAKAAEFAEGGHQIGALKGMMLKHTVSIYDLMDDACNGKMADEELWNEKIVDHIAYLTLLYGMVVEHYDETSNYKE